VTHPGNGLMTTTPEAPVQGKGDRWPPGLEQAGEKPLHFLEAEGDELETEAEERRPRRPRKGGMGFSPRPPCPSLSLAGESPGGARDGSRVSGETAGECVGGVEAASSRALSSNRAVRRKT